MLHNVLCIVPYNRYSQSAKMLATRLSIYQMPHAGLVRGGHHVINWGYTNWNVPVACKVYNKPSAVAIAVNKLASWDLFKENNVPIPEYTTDKEIAKSWIAKKSIVLCRKLLKASEGRGIVVAKKEVDIVPAKVYTRYVRKDREYRVHVFDGQIIGHKRKIKQANTDIENKYIRSHSNGYKYILDGANPLPTTVGEAALKAVAALKLDFGGVDLVFVEKKNKAYVLEINTAPGLTPTTCDWYAKAIKRNY